VTTYATGETITITILETVNHPGHYRVALSTTTEDALPADPAITQVGMDQCGMTEVMDPAVYPVLADGMLEHTTSFNMVPQSFEVTLPDDVECQGCYLQVIEYMAMHGAPCFYHHCAVINIEADPSAGTDGSGGSTGSDPSTTGDSGTTSAGTTTTTSGGTSDSGGGSDTTTSTSAASDSGTGAATDSGSDSGGEADGDTGGCSVAAGSPGMPAATLLLLGLFGLRRRYF
jgi:MYXO-CTERM domain-containing protein